MSKVLGMYLYKRLIELPTRLAHIATGTSRVTIALVDVSEESSVHAQSVCSRIFTDMRNLVLPLQSRFR